VTHVDVVKRFKAKLEPVSRGGHYVVVPDEVATAVGIRHGSRVRGTCNGVAFRSSTPKYSGVFHMGIHKATLAEAEVKPGATVTIAIEIDSEPLPGDEVPADLLAAIKKSKATAAWAKLPPSHKREHVNAVLDAKKPETRARRVEKAIAMLLER
jgi:hypothetical protein